MTLTNCKLRIHGLYNQTNRWLSVIFVSFLVLTATVLLSCNDNRNTYDESMESTEFEEGAEKETEEMTETVNREALMMATTFVPTVYNVDEIKTADKTVAGSFEAWKGEVIKNGQNNDDPTENAVILSPFHTLVVNGVSVPVYTARCGLGAHSFAWIDITSEGEDFLLELSLTLSVDIGKCVVLPESRGVTTTLDSRTVVSDIKATGSFTYTFATSAEAAVTDPELAPLTVMVSYAEEISVPFDYKIVEIEPGYHGNYELEFKEEYTAYYIKAGFHDISSIGLPSNSILVIERGVYLQVTDRQNKNDQPNTMTAIHADDVENVKIISRGLLDCGKLQGGDHKYKHVVNTGRSKNVLISGLTVINSNTWTICAYSAESPRIERNLLLSYRTYSDGIMMSECTNGVGRYNFVRTGDDAIEFKGTGWWGEGIGRACVYEHNDLWTDKGAGYCLTWESSRPMTNMIFRNNSVGFAQPTWTNRNTAIDCLLGTNAEITWSNVVFENIEIYHVISPNAINVQIQGNGAKLRNITFKNITVTSAKDGVYAFRMHFSAGGGSIKDICLDHVTFCGKRLQTEDITDRRFFCNEAGTYFDEIRVN